MHHRGNGARRYTMRGRGAEMFNKHKFVGSPSNNHPLDARDKLIGSRRPLSDARVVIRKHIVDKVGDLRAMLPPKRGMGRRSRGDLRSGLRVGNSRVVSAHTRPELVYADDLKKNKYVSDKNTAVTVGRGGKVTISRRRGRSIEREPAEESVQPTGIPAHMRRQPSPPPPRDASRSPPAQYSYGHEERPGAYHRQQRTPSPQPNHSGYTSYSPPPDFPHSTIVLPQKRGRAPTFNNDSPIYDDWSDPRVNRVDYRHKHRSRSPISRDKRHASSASYSRRANRPTYVPTSPSGGYDRLQSSIGDHWQRERSLSPVAQRMSSAYSDYDRDRVIRSIYHRSPSPPPRREVQDSLSRQMYVRAHSPSPHQPSLRMDRVPSNDKPAYYKERVTAEPERRRQTMSSHDLAPSSPLPPPATQNTTFYTVKVTSLSHEVSEDDVVELFSDIGPLISAKLITKGHAEVSFVNKKDAKTAIEKYDQRELDGIPMNLRLIEKTGARPKAHGYNKY